MQMKKIIELADTTSANNTATQAKKWLSDVILGAKKLMYFEQVAKKVTVPEGYKDIVVPYLANWLSTMDDTTTEGAEVTATTMDTINGVTLTPSPHAYSIVFSYHALRINQVNLLDAARQNLMYYYADVVDQAIRDALLNATAATSTARGRQTLFGGDATSKDTLETGDTITTDLIAKAKRYLRSTTCRYWSGGTEGISSDSKFPWRPEANQPFVLFMAPEQENKLLTDSQFVNAAEFGGREAILNGEIAKYLGIKLVVSDNTASFTDGGASADIAGHRLLLVKSGVCGVIAWGKEPQLRIVDFPVQLEKRLILEMAYDTSALHPDSIVDIYVTDE